jgi:D-amino peptidase
MNIYIVVDAEGISGIYEKDQVIPSGNRYNECRELMTAEINICVEACKEAGAEKVIVRDAHGAGNNILLSKLSGKADHYIIGQSNEKFLPGFEECDGLILLGYHAMAGTHNAILEHSWDSTLIQNIWLNGKISGEIAIAAGIAGDYGKPIIMVAGDDKTCKEAKKFMPDVITAEVKKGISCMGGMFPPLSKSYEIIREKTIKAIKNIHKQKPLVYEKPVKMRIELIERGTLPSKNDKPYMKIIDGRSYEVEGDTVEQALKRM